MALFGGVLQQGLLYSLVGMGVFISFKILRTPDLTADGAFVLGGAVSAVLVLKGHPGLALILAGAAGALAGAICGLLQTKIKIAPVLAGFLTMSGLYSINLAIQGGASNLSLIGQETLFTSYLFSDREKAKAILPLIGCVLLLALLVAFFHTEYGLCLCAIGSNPHMGRSLGISEEKGRILGLSLANGCVALAGSLIVQYQGYADINSGAGTMLTGLAGVVLGEAILSPKRIHTRLAASVAGVIIYQMLIALAIRYNVFPAYSFKLISVGMIGLTLGLVHIQKKK